MKQSQRATAFAIISALLGAFAFYKTNQVIKPFIDPIAQLCQTTPNDFSLQPFEKRLGGTFICVITQFMYQLTQHVSGFITWMVVVAMFQPVSTMMVVESGRRHAMGPVRYLTVLGVLSQWLGVSVVVPLLWVPSYWYSSSRGGGSVSTTRLYTSMVLGLPSILLSVAVFFFSTKTYSWTVCAALLAGPGLPLLSLLYWNMVPAAGTTDTPATLTASYQTTMYVYLFNGLTAFLLYAVIVYTIQLVYGNDFASLHRSLWGDAHPAVKFMTIDGIVLYLAVLCYIGMQSSLSRVLETIVLTPLMGPGAAPALVLAKIQVECVEEVQKQQASKVKKS